MSDLISRKALIEKIRKYGICGSGYSDEERINDVIDMIESEPPAQQWIPCSERLPEKRKRVLIQTDCCNLMAVGFMNENSEWFAEDGDGYCTDIMAKPIAWMPLPEAYRGE